MSNPAGATAFGLVRKSERATWVVVALLGIFFTVAAGIFALARPGLGLVYLSFDIPFLFHRAGFADDIRIVFIDEMDSGFLNRESQAALLDRLGEAGAEAVVYDIIFDRNSEDPAVDQEFAASMRRFRGVDTDGNPIPGARRRVIMLACGRKLLRQAGIMGEQLILPNDDLLDAADDFGLVSFIHDDRFTVRELSTGNRDEASLAWKSAVALGAALDESERSATRWLNFTGPPPHPEDPDAVPPFRSCTGRNVLDGVEPGFFRGKIVVIGGNPGIVGAAAGSDLFSTPFHSFDARGNLPLVSGVEIQATALVNLLHRDWLTRSSQRSEFWMIVALGTLLGAGMTRLHPLKGLLVGISLILLCGAAGVFAVHFADLWFPWSVVGFLQIPVAWGWSTASRFYIERFFRLKLSDEQRQLREAFSRYVSPQMLDRLTSEKFAMRLGGDKVDAAILFTDLEGFTDMCQKIRDPERIVHTLNDYFNRTTMSIFEYDGVVIKFIGDAIFAAWGVPVADPDAAGKAARATWKLFMGARLLVDGEELRTRIGLNFGSVVAGNLGSDQHMDYTLIGDDVNLAARLEGLNKMLHTSILMSGEFHARLQSNEFVTRRVGKFRVKGRQDVTEVFELVGPATREEIPAWITDYHQALLALESGDSANAVKQFEAVMASRPATGDGPSRFFLKRIKDGEDLRDGIVGMTEK